MDKYLQLATSTTPATIIYLVDISASMDKRMGDSRRIDVTFAALRQAIRKILSRATKGEDIQPRYKIGIIAYSDGIVDLIGGLKTIDQLAGFKLNVPEPQNKTETALAFRYAYDLLVNNIRYMNDDPAPLICHLTDDKYTGEDPSKIVEETKKIFNKDGHVLIENIYINDKFDIRDDIKQWPGVIRTQQLSDEYANTLRNWSSPIPVSYRSMMKEMGYQIKDNTVLLLPGKNPELVQLGFQISTVTGVKASVT